jgi:hypothetical protein
MSLVTTHKVTLKHPITHGLREVVLSDRTVRKACTLKQVTEGGGVTELQAKAMPLSAATAKLAECAHAV